MSLPFLTLALGGGGIKGVLQIGALRELSKHQELYFSGGVYGCSIGSILATYIAFELPIEKAEESIRKYLSFDRVIPKFSISHFQNVFSTKGAFEMDMFEKTFIELFDEHGIDIRTKKIRDAHMPLYIVSSNITRQKATVFSDKVSIIDAVKASCCIPGVFKPHEIYGDLYLDGGLFVPFLGSVISNKEEALILSLEKHTHSKITPSTIESISPVDYARDLYSITMKHFHDSQKTKNTLVLTYPNLYSDSDLTLFKIDDILLSGEKQLHGFLLSKSTLKE